MWRNREEKKRREKVSLTRGREEKMRENGESTVTSQERDTCPLVGLKTH